MKSQVLLPKIFNFPFTYNSRIENKIGNLVEVPFGSKKEIGVIWKNNYTEPENIKIKYINKSTEYSIDRKLIDFIEWFSTYNMVPIGLVLKMAIGGSDNFIKNKDSSLEIKKTKKRYFRLNDEQISALKFLEKVNNKFDVSVLQGTTGSGKTLVYFERIKKIIDNNQQALVLLPEIFLTNEFKSRFEDFFGFEPSIWHSKITPKRKRMIWKGLIKNKIKILVGARSALLLPFKKLGLIIVDEEHDNSYKQDEGVIYNARDMAISRAQFENIPIHLVTSVPSIETFNNIQKNQWLNEDTPTLKLIDKRNYQVIAFVSEQDISFLDLTKEIRFTPSSTSHENILAYISSISKSPISNFDMYPMVTSIFDGPIAASEAPSGGIQSEQAYYKVTLDLDQKSSAIENKMLGVVNIGIESKSYFNRFIDFSTATLIRELNF